MTIKTVCFLGFPWEKMETLERAARGAGLNLTEGAADLLVVNGPSNVITGNGICVALVKDDGGFYQARRAGAKAAYPVQDGWRETEAVLRQAVADIDRPIPSLNMRLEPRQPHKKS